ncbi:MAG TPA: hypothetical protein VNO32_30510, partial [Candidatus Acidoferrum sp.]|nr:hypothetical protein [Candidatus Acidoferrum sp.]
LLRLIQLDALMQRCDLLSQLNNPLLSERIHYQNYTLDGFQCLREQQPPINESNGIWRHLDLALLRVQNHPWVPALFIHPKT